MPLLRIWHVVSKQKQAPYCHQDKAFVHYLDEVVEFVLHRSYTNEVAQDKAWQSIQDKHLESDWSIDMTDRISKSQSPQQEYECEKRCFVLVHIDILEQWAVPLAEFFLRHDLAIAIQEEEAPKREHNDVASHEK